MATSQLMPLWMTLGKPAGKSVDNTSTNARRSQVTAKDSRKELVRGGICQGYSECNESGFSRQVAFARAFIGGHLEGRSW